jgi:hypothetical protein
MSEETQADKLVWERSDQIAVPAAEAEGRLAIREFDWKRLKSKVKRCSRPSSKLPVAYSIAFGVSGSAFLSLIAIHNAEGLGAWVFPLYLITGIFSLLFGCACIYLESKNDSAATDESTDLLAEMEELEKMFPSSSPPGNSKPANKTEQSNR